jgi:hypothetical protein
MKTIIAIVVICLSISANAQTWNEWVNQKKTKLRYIAQQIAAFKVYADYLKKGYGIMEKGWSAVNDIKHDDYDLHHNYFNSLMLVNNTIGNYKTVDSITSIQMQILKVNDVLTKFTQTSAYLQSNEKEYIRKVMSNLLQKCSFDLEELKTVTTDSTIQMKDDERLNRIDDIYADMQNKYTFAKYFNSSVQTLALSRAKNVNDVNTSRLLHGIK